MSKYGGVTICPVGKQKDPVTKGTVIWPKGKKTPKGKPSRKALRE